jgi:mannose-6-phosphate isomerase-like protein (cupin superfamily)
VGNVEFLATTDDTPFFNLAMIVLRPGQRVDGHVHEGEDDSFLVVDGTLTLTVGDDRREVRAGPGTFVLVPSGTFHELANADPADVRFLNVHAPGGFDRRIGLRGQDTSSGTSSAAVRTPPQRATSPGRSRRSTGAVFSYSPQLAFGSIHMTSNSLPSGSRP